MRRKLAVLLGLMALSVGLAMALLLVRSSSQATGNYTVSTVDPLGYGNDSSVAIGTDGLPIISYDYYTLSGDSDLKVAHCSVPDCSSATTVVVDPTGGRETSIAIGTDGLPIISYRTNGVSLYAAHCGNIDCTSANVITQLYDQVLGSELTIGSDGLPVIAFYDYSNFTLGVVHCGDVFCASGNTISQADDGGGAGSAGYENAIAIGADGLPIISHKMASGAYVRVTHCGNVLCSAGNISTVVDNTGAAGWGTSITIGADGLALISYRDDQSPGYGLRVAHCGNQLCNSGTTIAAVSQFGGSRSTIKIGAEGLPVISQHGLSVTHCGNATCTSGNTTVQPDTSGETKTALAVGADGLPIVTYEYGVQLRAVHCGDVACGGLKPTPTPTSTPTPSGYDPAVTALNVPTVGTINHGQPQTKKVSGTVKNQGTNVDLFTVTLRVDYNFDFEADWVGLPGDTVQNNVFCFGSCSGAFYSQLTYTEFGNGGILPDESIGLSRNLVLSCPAPNFSFPQSFFIKLSVASDSGLDDNPGNSSQGASRSAYCTDPSIATATPTPTITPTPTPKDPDGDTDGDTVPNSADSDDDGDGCPDLNENQTAVGSELSGGRRNPHNRWDYFNPTGDGMNRVDDILLVVLAYYADDNDANPGLPPYAAGYDPTMDRTLLGPNLWELGPPNGQQRVDDILNAVRQYHHDCS